MRRLLVVAVLVAGIGGVIVAVDAAPAERRSCAPQAARLRLASERVQVYRVRGRTYACHIKTGKRQALSDYPSSASQTVIWLSAMRLAGDLVGHGIVVSRSEDWPGVNVRNVRTGRLVHSVEAITALGRQDRWLRAYVTDLVLHPSGDVAWIAQNAHVNPVRFEVFKLDTTAGRVLLDASPAIRPESLALSGREIYWINGDEPHSNRLR
jgi:hypothetical protein